MRYIDAEKLKKYLINRSFYPSIVKRAIEEALTEDVVPRAEVEELNWQLERERGYIEFLKTNLLKAKQDVAREMLEEFESTIEMLHQSANVTGDIMVYWKTFKKELEKKYIGE